MLEKKAGSNAGCFGSQEKDSDFVVSRYETSESCVNGTTPKLELRPVLRGGGVRKSIGGGVRKSIAKNRGSYTTTTADNGIFDSCLQTACQVDESNTCRLKLGVQEMNVEKLQAFHDYLVKDQSVNAIKLKSILIVLPVYGKLDEVVQRANSSMEKLLTFVQSDLAETYGGSSDKETVQNPREMVGKVLAVKEHVAEVQKGMQMHL